MTEARRLTQSEVFKHVHGICRMYSGNYRQRFARTLREVHAQGGLVWGFNV